MLNYAPSLQVNVSALDTLLLKYNKKLPMPTPIAPSMSQVLPTTNRTGASQSANSTPDKKALLDLGAQDMRANTDSPYLIPENVNKISIAVPPAQSYTITFTMEDVSGNETMKSITLDNSDTRNSRLAQFELGSDGEIQLKSSNKDQLIGRMRKRKAYQTLQQDSGAVEIGRKSLQDFFAIKPQFGKNFTQSHSQSALPEPAATTTRTSSPSTNTTTSQPASGTADEREQAFLDETSTNSQARDAAEQEAKPVNLNDPLEAITEDADAEAKAEAEQKADVQAPEAQAQANKTEPPLYAQGRASLI